MSKRSKSRTKNRRPILQPGQINGGNNKESTTITSSNATTKRSGLKGVLLVGVAAFSLILALFVEAPLLQLLTGGPEESVAVFAWNVSSLTIGSAAMMLLLIGHAELWLAKDPRERRWGEGRLLADTLTFISTAILWALAFTFLFVISPSPKIQVLDLLGRVASIGTVVGLVASTIWGVRLYAEVFPRMKMRAKFEAIIILLIGGANYSAIWY